MTFVATPDPLTEPPSVELDFTLSSPGSIISYTVTRNGDVLRFNTVPSGDQIILTDSEAEYGTPLNYTISGTYLPDAAPDWTEDWAVGWEADWSGDEADWTPTAGTLESDVLGAAITRSASGTIQKVDVSLPADVRIEVLDSLNTVVASVEVTDQVILIGTSPSSAPASPTDNTFTMVLSSGTVSATADNGAWSLVQEYTGTPSKVRLVAANSAKRFDFAWNLASPTHRAGHMWGDAAGNVYAVDYALQRVRKFNGSTGAPITDFAIGAGPILSGIWGNGTHLFITTYDGFGSNTIEKYTVAGAFTTSFAAANTPIAISGDSLGNLYVIADDDNSVRKYNAAGVLQWTRTLGGSGDFIDVWVSSTNRVYVLDRGNGRVREYNTAGTLITTWAVTGSLASIWGDPVSGDIYVGDIVGNRIRQFDASGTAKGSWAVQAGETPAYMTGNAAGSLFTSNSTRIAKYVPKTAMVDDISATLVVSSLTFSESVTTQLDVLDAWMIHPLNTSLSINIHRDKLCQEGIQVSERTKKTRNSATKRILLQPVGRTRSIAITQQDRMVPTWDLVLIAETIVDRDEVDAFLAADVPFLLRSPASFEWDLPDDWYSIGDVNDERLADPLVLSCGHSFHLLTLPLNPVDPPTEPTPPSWTYGQDFLAYATYADSLAAEPTYLDRLVGPSS